MIEDGSSFESLQSMMLHLWTTHQPLLQHLFIDNAATQGFND